MFVSLELYQAQGLLSKSIRGIFHFRSRLVFIKVYMFVQHKA